MRITLKSCVAAAAALSTLAVGACSSGPGRSTPPADPGTVTESPGNGAEPGSTEAAGTGSPGTGSGSGSSGSGSGSSGSGSGSGS
ncbi:MAG TPA: hypothetical protein VK028_16015, partial [Micromonosporaceae bacterium]|nr:hypothetical protein [Micromonosporaceae bacterium]